MKKLKSLLQCNYIFFILVILSLLFVFLSINIEPKSVYNENTKNVIGFIKDYKIKDNKLTLHIKADEDLIVNYYLKDDENINVSYGDYIKVSGVFFKPSNNTNFNLFNYRKYLLSKKIKYTIKANNIKLIKSTNNIFYILKNKLLLRINKCKKLKGYLKTFVFADKNNIDEELFFNYQRIGISHLFAISGMHVSFISMFLLKILSFIKENKRYILISIFLMFYLFLTNFTVSMMRACFQFILFFINKAFKLKIKNINLLLLLFSMFLFYNPYYIYNIGFIFSFIISLSLILFNKLIDKGNYVFKLLKISLISFLVSIPIIINNYYQINLLSILFNIFYVPFVSFILFPLSILTLIFPMLDDITFYIINFFENITNNLSNIDIFTFYISKIPLILIILYYLLLYKLFNNINFKYTILIILFIIIFIFNKSFVLSPKVIFLDVKQGDSTLIRILNKNILIDTGGIVSFDAKNNYNLSEKILIPYFKSEGVKKIDFMIITHGDYDHMGEAINLVNNFKVEKVIFNCEPFNDLEKDLIEVLDKKKIKYYSCIKELNINNNKLYFLQTKEYDNENDNSNVIYTELNGYKFMFMGDAGVDKENDILDKYNLSNIDVLKVGHHGSKTSSGKEFIKDIKTKYSIISVGKNNRYGHPNKEVLNNLENSKIYRTDWDGSIMFKIKKNKLQIETCNP